MPLPSYEDYNPDNSDAEMSKNIRRLRGRPAERKHITWTKEEELAMSKNYLKNYFGEPTPQSEALDGQVPNSAGGNAWEVDIWKRLMRFLILGSEGGTYYVSERDLLKGSVDTIKKCLQADHQRTVDTIVTVSTGGRAPKNDQAIFALSIAVSYGLPINKAYALKNINAVCRTATHLFDFLTYAQQQRGWGRAFRRSISEWYTNRDEKKLSYQLIKYRQRNGWTHRDVFRKAHPVPSGDVQTRIFKWVAQHDSVDYSEWGNSDAEDLIAAYEIVKLDMTEKPMVIKLLTQFDLPREALPTKWLKDPDVWTAMLKNDMPVGAMIRNIRNMTNYGVFNDLDNVEHVVSVLTNRRALSHARIHPIGVLLALMAYRHENNMNMVPAILDALGDAFDLAFEYIEPSNKRISLALDVSGSMSFHNMLGIEGFTPRVASAVMAMATARVEPHYEIAAFSGSFQRLNLTGRDSLEQAVRTVSGLGHGRTDCALPMMDALANRKQFDAFVIYTDSETWYGSIHPAEALKEYNKEMGLNAKLIVVAMEGNDFTIADPNNTLMLDCVGFDASTPAVISAFIAE
jgi:60 kDa SS-A/Ro ribonucleoprotein